MFFEESKQLNKTPSGNTSQSNSKDDRRYFPRWQANNKVMYRKQDDMYPHVCLSKDIHCEGMCLRAPEAIASDQKLALVIYLSPDSDPINADGRVMWNRTQGHDNLVGIHFERLTSAAREKIFNYAFDFQREDMVKNWFKGW